MRVTTTSGAVYEFTKDKRKFRRLKNKLDRDPNAEVPRADLRQDGKWLELFSEPHPVVGYPMVLNVYPLDPPQVPGAEVTVRMTSVVVGVEE